MFDEIRVPKAYEDADPPDMDLLGEWAMDTMGEAACPHGCSVEHDGYCPHGRPSWVSIVLGV